MFRGMGVPDTVMPTHWWARLGSKMSVPGEIYMRFGSRTTAIRFLGFLCTFNLFVDDEPQHLRAPVSFVPKLKGETGTVHFLANGIGSRNGSGEILLTSRQTDPSFGFLPATQLVVIDAQLPALYGRESLARGCASYCCCCRCTRPAAAFRRGQGSPVCGQEAQSSHCQERRSVAVQKMARLAQFLRTRGSVVTLPGTTVCGCSKNGSTRSSRKAES
ncbi:hypothetical protein BDZ88DRAFT_242244 [Geranomyces variabilis]|nr:hypothetical protein BDZ88DRAFT_242244 [Geranomyces variabilis]